MKTVLLAVAVALVASAPAEFEAARRLALAGRHAEAARAFRTFAEREPRSPFAPTALYQAAYALERMGDRNGAAALYREIGRRYAAHEMSRFAQVRLAEIEAGVAPPVPSAAPAGPPASPAPEGYSGKEVRPASTQPAPRQARSTRERSPRSPPARASTPAPPTSRRPVGGYRGPVRITWPDAPPPAYPQARRAASPPVYPQTRRAAPPPPVVAEVRPAPRLEPRPAEPALPAEPARPVEPAVVEVAWPTPPSPPTSRLEFPRRFQSPAPETQVEPRPAEPARQAEPAVVEVAWPTPPATESPMPPTAQEPEEVAWPTPPPPPVPRIAFPRPLQSPAPETRPAASMPRMDTTEVEVSTPATAPSRPVSGVELATPPKPVSRIELAAPTFRPVEWRPGPPPRPAIATVPPSMADRPAEPPAEPALPAEPAPQAEPAAVVEMPLDLEPAAALLEGGVLAPVTVGASSPRPPAPPAAAPPAASPATTVPLRAVPLVADRRPLAEGYAPVSIPLSRIPRLEDAAPAEPVAPVIEPPGPGPVRVPTGGSGPRPIEDASRRTLAVPEGRLLGAAGEPAPSVPLEIPTAPALPAEPATPAAPETPSRPNPEAARSNIARAAGYRRLGMWDLAEAEYRRAIEADPANPVSYNNLADLLIEQGRAEEALALIDRALELKPDDPGPYLATLGWAYHRRGEDTLAAEALTESLQHGVTGVRLYYMGAVQAALGDRVAARGYLEKAFAYAEDPALVERIRRLLHEVRR